MGPAGARAGAGHGCQVKAPEILVYELVLTAGDLKTVWAELCNTHRPDKSLIGRI